MKNPDQTSKNSVALISNRISALLTLWTALWAFLFIASCGMDSTDGKTDLTSSAANATGRPAAVMSNQMIITTDEYGLQSPNYYYTTDNETFWSIQAAIAKDVHDPGFRCVIRIDILKSASAFPALNKTYSISHDPRYETFPGTLYVFNGHKSVMKKVEQGILAFAVTNDAANIEGTFDAVITDYDSRLVPSPQYRFAASFSFGMGTYGPADPLPAEVFPAQGKTVYEQFCAACHSLGEYDTSAESASDLSMRGGELPQVFPGSLSSHQGLVLDAQSTQNLRVFLNAW